MLSGGWILAAWAGICISDGWPGLDTVTWELGLGGVVKTKDQTLVDYRWKEGQPPGSEAKQTSSCSHILSAWPPQPGAGCFKLKLALRL